MNGGHQIRRAVFQGGVCFENPFTVTTPPVVKSKIRHADGRAASGQCYLFGGVLIRHQAVASNDHGQRFVVGRWSTPDNCKPSATNETECSVLLNMSSSEIKSYA
jgi:hypothetical protein